MKAFSDCDEVEKIGRIGDGIIVLELLTSVVVSLHSIRSFLGYEAYAIFAYCWSFVFFRSGSFVWDYEAQSAYYSSCNFYTIRQFLVDEPLHVG